jgi:Ca2+/H+ antiporter, TMEM165/GDT1 family
MSLRNKFSKYFKGWQSVPLFIIAIVLTLLQAAVAESQVVGLSDDNAEEKKQNFARAFVKSFGIIIASEIGDKTFIIAAIMAMKHPRGVVRDIISLNSYPSPPNPPQSQYSSPPIFPTHRLSSNSPPLPQVFAGAMAALVIMTILSTVLGAAAPALLPKTWTHYAATLLFFGFGVKMLWDVFTEGHEGPGESELDEVERELAITSSISHPHSSGDIESMSLNNNNNKEGTPTKTAKRTTHPPLVNTVLNMLPHSLKGLIPPIFAQVFTLTFLGEWGDRSQIATVGLAADADLLGVALGGFLGHGLCTGGAVVGGKHLASRIDERLVTIAGGILFLLFGLHSLWVGPSS